MGLLGRHIVVAGGGVGAIEAALALRALGGDLPGIDLVAPEREFLYRAMTVAEPFGHGRALTVPLERLERSHAVRHRQDALSAVDVEARRARLRSGEEIAYDALVVAVGARPLEWLAGAVTFTGPAAVPAVRQLLERVRRGDASSVLFAAPPGASWTLPVYELALLMSTWCADNGVVAPQLTIATSEIEPLVVFGPAGARAVRDVLADRGIRLLTGTTVMALEGANARLARDVRLPADAVLALPRLVGNPVRGLPADSYGFIPVDEHCAVSSTPGVYGVGDATTHSLKQGGLATQQADAAAAAIAHAFGVPIDAAPYRPIVRGLLLTGVTSVYLRQGADGTSDAAFHSLWWPPTKVAGRYLAPFLAELHPITGAKELADPAAPADRDQAAHYRRELRRLARDFAEADAQWGDHRSALRWLQTIEWLDGVVPPELAELRDRWRAAAREAVATPGGTPVGDRQSGKRPC